jgi:hypothetical protein
MAKKTTDEQKQWVNKQIHGTELVKNTNHKTEDTVYRYSSKGIAIFRESSTITGIPYYIKRSFNERPGLEVVTIKLIVERVEI